MRPATAHVRRSGVQAVRPGVLPRPLPGPTGALTQGESGDKMGVVQTTAGQVRQGSCMLEGRRESMVLCHLLKHSRQMQQVGEEEDVRRNAYAKDYAKECHHMGVSEFQAGQLLRSLFQERIDNTHPSLPPCSTLQPYSSYEDYPGRSPYLNTDPLAESPRTWLAARPRQYQALQFPDVLGKVPGRYSEQEQERRQEQERELAKQEELRRLEGLQRQWETRCQAEAQDRFRRLHEDLVALGKGAQVGPIHRQMMRWFRPLEAALKRKQEQVWRLHYRQNKMTFEGSLLLLSADKMAILALYEVVNLCLANGNGGVSATELMASLGDLVQAQASLLEVSSDQKITKQARASLLTVTSRKQVWRVRQKAMKLLEQEEWSTDVKLKTGAVLLKTLMETAKDENGAPAVLHELKLRGPGFRGWEGGKFRTVGMVRLSNDVHRSMVELDYEDMAILPRFPPMVVKPLEWRDLSGRKGPYLCTKAPLVRIRGGETQREPLRRAQLEEVQSGLNSLSGVQWRVNTGVLDVVKRAWAERRSIGAMPARDDPPLPEPPDDPSDTAANNAHRRERGRALRRRAEQHSLRCDMSIKMSIAQQLRDHTFYFPYNMDFRGRAYPVPPNFNHLGDDVCRGLLQFNEARPLGERGLRWLKIHLANLVGHNKLSFNDRVKFVDANLDQIRDSALRPLDGQGWWQQADEPWQALAVCMDLVKALDSPDPAQYESHIPVHQDGSCNGLQHYAALGKDANGGRQVNLLPSARPQDVYTGVCQLVAAKVAADAMEEPPAGASEKQLKKHRLAKMCYGLIDRKVVKQTVMTSVYGVTFVGARNQIGARLREKFAGPVEGLLLAEDKEKAVFDASFYIARLTMGVLAELFHEARGIMDWLSTLAHLVALQGQPMSWTTPMGLPVVQPYRDSKNSTIVTVLQKVEVCESQEDQRVSSQRQKSAFPPNFVHSLDSTHMLMTAKRMQERGIPFTAVHDSYWTHPGHVDEMNATLRDCFVELYSKPILEDLHKSLCLRFPGVPFPPVPPRGTLDVHQVRKSEYFFA